jgi:hypothetical protein
MIRSKNLPATSRARHQFPPVTVRMTGIQSDTAVFGSPGPTEEVWRNQLRAALGTASDPFVDMSLQHLMRAARMPGGGPTDIAINGALAIIAAIGPQNELEAALALQAACVHMAAMVMMARIGGGHGGDRRLSALGSTAAKLLKHIAPRSRRFGDCEMAGNRKSLSNTSPSTKAAKR